MAVGLAATLVLLTSALLYWFFVRARCRDWGATTEETRRVMLGDSEVAGATYETTLAVTVNAPAAKIWPWLLQLGDGRGGLYSYDWLDRLFGFLDAPSAERILPEWQHLQVGDVIPIGRGAGFPVKALEPLRTLVLAGESDGFQWAWQLGLYPLDERRTRLISRNRAQLPDNVRSALFMLALEPAAFIMTRKMLLGLKRRAESSAARRPESEVRVA